MMPAQSSPDSLPKSTAVSSLRVGDWLLTNAVWENSHGSYEPETGVRFMSELDANGRPRFELIQHRWHDFDAATDMIVKGLRKGWGAGRISDFMDNLKQRRRSRPTFL